MNRKYLISFILIILLLTPLVSAYPLETIMKETPTGFVTDKAGALTESEKFALENRISGIEKNTSAEIAIVLIDTLEGESLEYYAVQLFEKWGIGKKEINNGVLVLVAVNDRKARIEVGYGLEPYITDSRAGNIIRDDIAPEFKNEKYYAGLDKAITTIEQRIKTEPKAIGEAREKASEEFSESAFVFGGLGSFSEFVSGIVGGTGSLVVFLLLLVGALAGMKWIGSKLKETKAVGIMKALASNPIGFFFLIYFVVVSFSLILGILLFLALIISVMSVKGNVRSPGMIGYWGGGRGGFGGGSMGGGGFGGFGGGFSGGGGASGGW